MLGSIQSLTECCVLLCVFDSVQTHPTHRHQSGAECSVSLSWACADVCVVRVTGRSDQLGRVLQQFCGG